MFQIWEKSKHPRIQFLKHLRLMVFLKAIKLYYLFNGFWCHVKKKVFSFTQSQVKKIVLWEDMSLRVMNVTPINIVCLGFLKFYLQSKLTINTLKIKWSVL